MSVESLVAFVECSAEGLDRKRPDAKGVVGVGGGKEGGLVECECANGVDRAIAVDNIMGNRRFIGSDDSSSITKRVNDEWAAVDASGGEQGAVAVSECADCVDRGAEIIEGLNLGFSGKVPDPYDSVAADGSKERRAVLGECADGSDVLYVALEDESVLIHCGIPDVDTAIVISDGKEGSAAAGECAHRENAFVVDGVAGTGVVTVEVALGSCGGIPGADTIVVAAGGKKLEATAFSEYADGIYPTVVTVKGLALGFYGGVPYSGRVGSRPAVARRVTVPWGNTQMALTGPLWPWRVRWHVPVVGSQIRTVRSPPAVARRRRPWAWVNALTARTGSVWPWRVRWHVPVVGSQMRTVQSLLAVARRGVPVMGECAD